MATDRALSMYQSVLQKDQLNNEEYSISKILDLKKALEQANAKIENANQLSNKYKAQLQKQIAECNQLQQENKRLREAAETTKDDKLIVDRKKKSKQRTTKCPHGKARVSK